MSQTFHGIVKAKIIEARFAVSGKVSTVNKKRGDKVKKGELIASIDRRIFQTELDKQLADFEKTRAEFEIFNLKKGEPDNDIDKYLKTQKQAELDVSVKEVELAKARLDQADLFSPITGIIIDDSNIVGSIFITSASSPYKIQDDNGFYIEIEVDVDNLPLFLTPREVTVNIPMVNYNARATTKTLITKEKAGFLVEIPLPYIPSLISGMQADVILE